jgi:hypothetical protein
MDGMCEVRELRAEWGHGLGNEDMAKVVKGLVGVPMKSCGVPKNF